MATAGFRKPADQNIGRAIQVKQLYIQIGYGAQIIDNFDKSIN